MLLKHHKLIIVALSILLIASTGFSIYHNSSWKKKLGDTLSAHQTIVTDLTGLLAEKQANILRQEAAFNELQNVHEQLLEEKNTLNSNHQVLQEEFDSLYQKVFCENQYQFSYKSNQTMSSELINYLMDNVLSDEAKEKQIIKNWDVLWINSEGALHTITSSGFDHKFFVSFDEPQLKISPSVYWLNRDCFIDRWYEISEKVIVSDTGNN